MSTLHDTPAPTRLLDRRGRLRSPAAMPGFHKGRVPVTKGRTLDVHTVQSDGHATL
jgi:hypothetical protein